MTVDGVLVRVVGENCMDKNHPCPTGNCCVKAVCIDRGEMDSLDEFVSHFTRDLCLLACFHVRRVPSGKTSPKRGKKKTCSLKKKRSLVIIDKGYKIVGQKCFFCKCIHGRVTQLYGRLCLKICFPFARCFEFSEEFWKWQSLISLFSADLRTWGFVTYFTRY